MNINFYRIKRSLNSPFYHDKHPNIKTKSLLEISPHATNSKLYFKIHDKIPPKWKGGTIANMDRLIETKSDLREVFKALLYMILGFLTGIVTVIYKILIGSIPAYISILAGVGLIVTFLSVLYTLKVWSKMQELNEEMKNAD